MSHPYDEDALETVTVELLESLGWDSGNGYVEGGGQTGVTGRETLSEVILASRLLPVLERLNPTVPPEGLLAAVEALTADRSVMVPVRANKAVYALLRKGIAVTVPDDDGGETTERVRFIDWSDTFANDFYAVRQLWVTGDMYKRRADVVLFVNGIPLVVMELKASHKDLKAGYTNNITDYKNAIPQLFWSNGFIVVSNGSDARVGSVSAEWEHYAEWKKINSEGEKGIISLDTTIRATCEPARLLDLIENFIVFQEMRGGLVKLVAKNHQYLGVNNAIDALHDIEELNGRLGVFWHTQGSGKSVSMVFFTQKVLRTVPGNWTFLIVTDRRELDNQIYKTFQDTGAVTEGRVQADSGEDLKRLLREDHRYVFSLIHKFRTEKGETYPVLSERSDIVVITDEAHRTQYDVLALNMRNALPNAAFLGFTGTPLIAGEERTREVFGDYVSVYDFKASIEDRATVPLYYENRIPELQLTNEHFNEDMEQVLEDAALDEAQERRLAREFSREYQLITREERIDRVAEDLVEHFCGRGYAGKAMVVSVDKATAVRMYDRTQVHWKARIARLETDLAVVTDPWEQERLAVEIAWMQGTDMAVVVSQGQNEVADMKAMGLNIVPHRKRMVDEDLSTKFKDPDDPFRIVFVCAMWMTGFDVPSVSTIYLDKPMRNHTLMQTIARANRVFEDKTNGLIVDYVGVFRDLQRALAIYGTGPGGTAGEGDTPVLPKEELVVALRSNLAETIKFCDSIGVSLDDLIALTGFEFIKARDDAIDLILTSPETRTRFKRLAGDVDRLFKAILPDPAANEFGPYRAVLVNLVEKLRSLTPPADISEVMDEVGVLLDDSVAANAYIIRAAEDDAAEPIVDLAGIDFEALAAKFAASKRKRTEAEKLKALLTGRATAMARLNPARIDYLERLQALIDNYNDGAINLQLFFDRLMEFAEDLNVEDQRAISEQLTEEELAVFDLLTRPEPELSDAERAEVKKVARDLLDTLKREKLVIDWRKKQKSRASVRVAVEKQLDRLPKVFTADLWQAKVEKVYQHVYDSYYGEGRSIYEPVAA